MVKDKKSQWWVGVYKSEEKIPKWWKDFVNEMYRTDNAEVIKVIDMLHAIDKKETEENVEEVRDAIRHLYGLDEETINTLGRRLKISTNRIDRKLNDNFGALIKHLRTKNGYSLQDMQDMTGISASYVHRIEKGERKAPSYKIIEKLAGALGIEESALLEVANLENNSEEIIGVEELLYTHNFTIGNKQVNRKQKELFIKIMKKISDAKWTSDTKHIDSLEIVELIDSFKKLEK